MLVFVDESGDPGFKLTRGSSPHFILAMVIFEAEASARATQAAILRLLEKTGTRPEFKFNKCSNDVRTKFFVALEDHKFIARAIVVDKSIIYSKALRTVKESFYKFFVRQMIEKDDNLLKDAKLIIDGSGDRIFKKEFCGYLRRRLDPLAIQKVSLRDSVSDPLLQLSDMVAGAVARSYKPDRDDCCKWRLALERCGQLSNVWNFR